MKAGPETRKPTATDTGSFIRRPIGQTLILTALLGLAFAVSAFVFRNQFVFQGDRIWITLFLAGALLILAAIDIDRFLLPDWLTLPLIVLGLGYSYLFGVGLIQSGIGALVGYVTIAALAYIWRTKFGREGIGLGDAKLLSAAGAWVGVVSIPSLLMISSGLGLVIFALLSVFSESSEKGRYIPFGPLIILAFWVIWCAPKISV